MAGEERLKIAAKLLDTVSPCTGETAALKAVGVVLLDIAVSLQALRKEAEYANIAADRREGK